MSGTACSLITFSNSQNPGTEYHSYGIKNKQLGLLSRSHCPPSPLVSPKASRCHSVKPGAATCWILHAAVSASDWKAAGWEKVHIVQIKDKIREQEWHGSGNMHTEAPQAADHKNHREHAGRQWLDRVFKYKSQETSSNTSNRTTVLQVQLKQKGNVKIFKKWP